MDVATLSNKLNETPGYVVRPNFEEKFRSTKVQEILYSCISDVLGDKKFEQEQCPEWTKASMLFIHIPVLLSISFIDTSKKCQVYRLNKNL